MGVRRFAVVAFVAVVAVVVAACQPAPPPVTKPPVYHYSEVVVLRDYNVASAEMALQGAMLPRMRLSEPARCYTADGTREFECRQLADHKGKKVRVNWHGNPERGEYTVTRVQLVK